MWVVERHCTRRIGAVSVVIVVVSLQRSESMCVWGGELEMPDGLVKSSLVDRRCQEQLAETAVLSR